MIKTIKISDFFDNFSVTLAVDFDVFLKHTGFTTENDGLEYLMALSDIIIGDSIRNSLNVYGASFVAEQVGADCYTRGEHGVVLVDVDYAALDCAETIKYATKLPKPPECPEW